MGNCQRGETGTLLCPGAQCETDSKDAHHEEKRVGFRPCQRDFDAKQNSKRDAEENTVIPSEADRAVERARTEIDRDRADYTDCVQAGQRLEICCGHQHDNRKTDRDEQRVERDSVSIETFEVRRHFPVARCQVKKTNHRDNGGVGRAQQQQQKHNADDPAEGLPNPNSE